MAEIERVGTVQFSSWQLDLESGELFENGASVRLQPQPAKVLCLLARRRGTLVSRAEIQKALWDGETFVDFEGGLNYCIRQIRAVLRDDAGAPAYIETVPRRGYRFIAEVKSVSPPEPLLNDSSEAGVRAPITASEHQQRWPVHRWTLLTALVTAAIAFGLLRRTRHVPNPLEQPQVSSYSRLSSDGRAKDLYGSPDPLVSDGERIFFNETVGNQIVLAAVPVSGGEVSLLPTPFASAGVVDYSAATRQLLFASTWHNTGDQYLVAQSLTNHESRRLSDVIAHDASWSVDGRQLAFAKGSDLFVADHDGTRARKIAGVQGAAFWPRWSPDGRSLRFSEALLGTQYRLWQINLDGTDKHLLLRQARERDHICCGSWMKQGKYFVYLSLEPNRSDLWAVATDRALAQPVRLTAGPLDFWRGPLPARDGRRIFAIGEQLRGRLVRIDPATRKEETYLNGMSAEGLSFSPDGKYIAYTAFPEGSLWRSRKDGTQKLQLTFPPLLSRFPRWSPDGKTIAFTAGPAGSTWRVYTISASGGAAHQVLEKGPDQGVASWSPDGRSLAFGIVVSLSQLQTPGIQILNLTNGSLSIVAGSKGLWTPRWSPNGEHFAAVTADNQTLRLFEVKTQSWRDLASLGVNDVVWSPDSRYIFFDNIYGVDPAIYRVRISDRKVEPWASLKDVRRAGFFQPWLGITPDGSPILLDNVGIEEVYSLRVNLP